MPHEIFTPRPRVEIAYQRYRGDNPALPGVVWLGGFRSDMTGEKATFLEAECKKRGQSYLRFDYTGHGASSGTFADGCLGDWLHDALDVFDHLTEGPQILVGSSMGGWLSLLLTLRRATRVRGLVLIAPAPDFSIDIHDREFSDEDRATLARDGIVMRPNPYGDPYPLTRRLFDDAAQYLLLHDAIGINCPVRILQGKKDDAVHWTKAEKIKQHLTSGDVAITYIDDGDHRLSRPQDLALIDAALRDVSGIRE